MDDLLNEIDAFCAAHDLTDSKFGRLAMNDTKFVGRLRAGKGVLLSTAQKVRTFMLTYVPQREAA